MGADSGQRGPRLQTSSCSLLERLAFVGWYSEVTGKGISSWKHSRHKAVLGNGRHYADCCHSSYLLVVLGHLKSLRTILCQDAH